MKHVFVYGTLKTDLPNHYLLKDSKNGSANLVFKGKTFHKYPLIVTTPFNIPFLLNKQGHGEIVEGEVYKVDDKMLSVLDELEREGKLYDRLSLDIVPLNDSQESNSSLLSCDTYVINGFKDSLMDLAFLESFTDSSNYVSPRDVKRTLEEVLHCIKN